MGGTWVILAGFIAFWAPRVGIWSPWSNQEHLIFPNLHLKMEIPREILMDGVDFTPISGFVGLSFSLAGSQLWGPGPNAGLPALRHFQKNRFEHVLRKGPRSLFPPRDYGSYRWAGLAQKFSFRSSGPNLNALFSPHQPPNHQQIAIPLFALAGNEALQGVAGCARHGQRGYGSVDSNHGPIFGADLGSARDRGAGPPGGRLRIGIGAGDL